jgi:hypothetical protein
MAGNEKRQMDHLPLYGLSSLARKWCVVRYFSRSLVDDIRYSLHNQLSRSIWEIIARVILGEMMYLTKEVRNEKSPAAPRKWGLDVLVAFGDGCEQRTGRYAALGMSRSAANPEERPPGCRAVSGRFWDEMIQARCG